MENIRPTPVNHNMRWRAVHQMVITMLWPPKLKPVDVMKSWIFGLLKLGHNIRLLNPNRLIRRIAYKCDVRIEDIRKEEVMVTLWGDIGEAFSSLSMDAFSLPVVVVFTSLKVKL
ncbi:hypothetical protein C1H46_013106 [Malus baccata]|uniref:Replication protein A OB domain-containing protein n=1 Tax=Malus baccata TaxID=106549 RepID=A0A540MSF2_MALBA|nr:hypothetical protein C1H46_013106 [Malus baccata]